MYPIAIGQQKISLSYFTNRVYRKNTLEVRPMPEPTTRPFDHFILALDRSESLVMRIQAKGRINREGESSLSLRVNECPDVVPSYKIPSSPDTASLTHSLLISRQIASSPLRAYLAHCLLTEDGNEVGRMRSVIPYIFAIQHRMNPLHVYCRFRDSGYRRGASVFYCRVYEIIVFSWVRIVLHGVLIVARRWNRTDQRPLWTHCATGSRREDKP